MMRSHLARALRRLANRVDPPAPFSIKFTGDPVATGRAIEEVLLRYKRHGGRS